MKVPGDFEKESLVELVEEEVEIDCLHKTPF